MQLQRAFLHTFMQFWKCLCRGPVLGSVSEGTPNHKEILLVGLCEAIFFKTDSFYTWLILLQGRLAL